MPKGVAEHESDEKTPARMSRPPAEFTEEQRAWVRDIAERLKEQRQDARLQARAKRSTT